MTLNEMMRNSADQKREQQQPSSTLRDELRTMNERLAAMEEASNQSALRAQLETLNERLAALGNASGQRPLREELEAIRGELEEKGEQFDQNALREQLRAVADNASSVAKIAERLLEAATQKESRADQTLDEVKAHTDQTRRVLSDVDRRAAEIKQAAQTIKGTPKALTAASKSARERLTKSVQFLTLKAAAIGVLIAVVTVALVTISTAVFLSSQDLSLRVITEDDEQNQRVGERIHDLHSNTWSEEERETWQTLTGSKTDGESEE